MQSCKLQGLSFGWPEPLAILKISFHASHLAGCFHLEVIKGSFHLCFDIPGLTAKESCLPCHTLVEIALDFGRHSSASEWTGEIAPDHLHLVEIVPHGGEIIVEIHKHSAQVHLRVDSFKGDTVDGDDGILGFMSGNLEFADAVGLLVSKAQFGAQVAGVKGVISNMHLAVWAALNGSAVFLYNADRGIGVLLEEMEMHAVLSSGLATAIRHPAFVNLYDFGA
jgi:hypothetical protein